MDKAKCESCHRRERCDLHELLVLTLPFVVVAHRGSGGETEWERLHGIGRALRGGPASPGYVEDWILAGAMEPADIEGIVREIVRTGRVERAALCRPCRHYVGPALAPAEIRPAA